MPFSFNLVTGFDLRRVKRVFLQKPNVSDFVRCLDLVEVSWCNTKGVRSYDEAILLEVSHTGGLLHSGLPIPGDLTFEIETSTLRVLAQVEWCEHDGYGFVVRFSVTSRSWFPRSFRPANLKPTQVTVMPSAISSMKSRGGAQSRH